MKLLWFAVILFLTNQPALSQSYGDQSRRSQLDKFGIYEPLVLFTPQETSTICNPHPFGGLKTICVMTDPLPEGKEIDVTSFVEKQLADGGLTIVDRTAALKTDQSIVHLQAHRSDLKDGGKKFVCVVSIEDVVTLKRQPVYKYRVDWWHKRITAADYHKGFGTLIHQLIAEYARVNPNGTEQKARPQEVHL